MTSGSAMKMKGVLIWCTLFGVVSAADDAGQTTGNAIEAFKVLDELVKNKANCPYWPYFEVSCLDENVWISIVASCNGVRRKAILELPSRLVDSQWNGCIYAGFLNKTEVTTYDPKTWEETGTTTHVVDVDLTVLPPPDGVLPDGNKTYSCALADPEAAAGSKDFLGSYVFIPTDGRIVRVFDKPFTLDVKYPIYKPKICGLVYEYMRACGYTNKPSNVTVDDKKNLVIDLPACKGWSQVKWTITITKQDDYIGLCYYDFDAELSARHENKDVKLPFVGDGVLKTTCNSIIVAGTTIPISKLSFVYFKYKSGGRMEQCYSYHYSFN